MDAPGCRTPCCAKAVASIESQHPELFVIEGGEPGSGPRDDRGPVGQPGRGLQGGNLDGSPSKFDGSCEPDGLGGADATVLGELADADAQKTADAAVLVEQVRRAGWHSGAPPRPDRG